MNTTKTTAMPADRGEGWKSSLGRVLAEGWLIAWVGGGTRQRDHRNAQNHGHGGGYGHGHNGRVQATATANATRTMTTVTATAVAGTAKTRATTTVTAKATAKATQRLKSRQPRIAARQLVFTTIYFIFTHL